MAPPVYTISHMYKPDCSRFHESESALHEEDDDGHDEEEEVVNVRGDGVVAVLEPVVPSRHPALR